MEIILAGTLGIVTAAGVWLMLRATLFSVILGLGILSYAVNFLILFSGRLNRMVPPIVLDGAPSMADPLPQALVLTAIVIGFGMTAYLAGLAIKLNDERKSDSLEKCPDEDGRP